uniref:Sphingomyelin phosphodiesterase n=1 Tax=Heterorhabditis bacteriophora TaxID=37862 RepID=A0A1I7X4F2_HETBA
MKFCLECCGLTLLRPSSFSIFVLSSANRVSNHNEWSAEIGRFLSVECLEDRMIVKLDYNEERNQISMTSSLSRSIESGKICLTQETEECCGNAVEAEKRHEMIVRYDSCGIVKNNVSYGFNYTTVVAITAGPTRRISHFDVSCTVATEAISQVKFDIAFHGGRIETELSSFTIPFNTELELNIHSLAALTFEIPDLYTYPQSCWTVSIEEEITTGVVPNTETSSKVQFMKNGCPAHRGGVILASMFQNYTLEIMIVLPQTGGSTAGSTTIYINSGEQWIPPSKSPKSSPTTSRIAVQCDVFLCTSSARHGIRGIPMCPSAAACEGTSWQQPRSQPANLLAANSIHTRFRPQLIVSRNKDDAAPPLRGPIHEPKRITIRDSSSPTAEKVQVGAPFWVVALVGAICFSTGVTFIAVIWCIHNSNAVPDQLRSRECINCHFAVKQLQNAWGSDLTGDCFEEMLIFLCDYLHIESNFICKTAVSNWKDELIYVLTEVIANPADLCSLLVNDCGKIFDPFNATWQFPMPGIKPPVVEKMAVKPGKPTIRVLHLTDLHIDKDYTIGMEAHCNTSNTLTLCCRPNQDPDELSSSATVKQPAGYWGTIAQCDAPYWMVDNMLMQITERHKDIDYVMVTGDLESHAIWDYNKRDHADKIRNISGLLRQYFPNKMVYFAVGNHEGVPCDMFVPHSAPKKFNMDWLYTTMADSWKGWVPEDQMEMVKYNGCYMKKLFPGLRLISLNNGYGDSYNFSSA